MESKNQNLVSLEAAVRGLGQGQSLPIEGLRETFEATTDDEAVTAARELAERCGCKFQYSRQQGVGIFLRL